MEQTALDLVRGCRFFSHRHEHLETYILNSFLDELEKRSLQNGTNRLMTTDGLKLIFNEILVGSIGDERTIDPAAEAWANVDPSDFRNLADKILAVCPEFNPKILQVLARKCGLARSVELGGSGK